MSLADISPPLAGMGEQPVTKHGTRSYLAIATAAGNAQDSLMLSSVHLY